MYRSKFLNPTNDIAFKKIFGSEENKNILIHFINDIMDFQDTDKIEEVTFLNPIQNPDVAYKKQSLLDILCKARDGSKIIIEMQASPAAGFEKRAQFYASKAYSSDLARGSDGSGSYYNLKSVIFIAISTSTIFPEKQDYISRHVVLDSKTYEHDLKDFSFTFIELPKFKIKKIEDLKTIVEKWCYFFKYADGTRECDVDKIASEDDVIQNAYEVLNQFNWTDDEMFEYERELKRVLDNYNVELYIKDTAAAQGKAIGIKEGIEQGLKEAKINMVKNMLKNKIDIETISKITDISYEEIMKL